ncbi:MAG: asparagine synthase-related protein [Tepidanaerobacteraceae bacterium]
MSGIVSIISTRGRLRHKTGTTRLKDMLGALKHRGRAGTKVFKVEKAVLGKTDSIQTIQTDHDLSKVNGGSEGPVIVADGSIPTGGDDISCEKAIAKKYENEGHDFVNNLDGSFAFVLADGDNIIAARDPFGVKPLYYTQREDEIVFASEIKALMDFEGKIEHFPPGCYYSSKDDFTKYYEIPNPASEQHTSQNEAIETVKDTIIEAVEKNCKHEHNVGVFLSGGVDSSIIAAACYEVLDNVKTYAVGSLESSDLPRANQVAEFFGLEHHEYIYTKDDIVDVLREVIYHLESFDMYLVRSAVVNYLLARMARNNGEELIFCGEGADEIFGGYHYLKKINRSKVRDELVKLLNKGHANGFQRVDRMTSAFSLEGRLPFVDRGVVEYGLSLPIEWKINSDGSGNLIEKWILRKAFEKYLPEEIVWRKKQKFFQGAGSDDLLASYADEKITDEEFERKRFIDGFNLRSKEEYLYFKIFKQYFPNDSVIDTIERTTTV